MLLTIDLQDFNGTIETKKGSFDLENKLYETKKIKYPIKSDAITSIL